MNSKTLSLVAVLMATMLVQGCTINKIDLVEKGVVSVEAIPSKMIKILWTDVRQDGEDMVVCGVVQRCRSTGYPIKTHVDIVILSPDGTILEEARTRDIYVARHTSGKGINWTRFRVRFPGIPAEGSKVNMVVHSGKHEKKEGRG